MSMITFAEITFQTINAVETAAILRKYITKSVMITPGKAPGSALDVVVIASLRTITRICNDLELDHDDIVIH